MTSATVSNAIPSAYCVPSDSLIEAVSEVVACVVSVGAGGVDPGLCGAERVASVMPSVMSTTDSWIPNTERKLMSPWRRLTTCHFPYRFPPTSHPINMDTHKPGDGSQYPVYRARFSSPPERKMICIGTGTLNPNAQLFISETARNKTTCTIHRRSGTIRGFNRGIQRRFAGSSGDVKVNWVESVCSVT